MKCGKCGEEIESGSRFCRVCGTPVSPSAEDEVLRGVGKIFIDPDEQLVGVLGRDYLDGYLSGSGIKRGFLAVSGRRLYQKGRAYVRFSGRRSLTKTKGSSVVDIADVTGTRIFRTSSVAKLVISIVFLIAAMCTAGYAFAFAGGDREFFCYIAGGLLMLSIVFLTAHLISKKNLVTITFCGGEISFDRKWFTKEEFYEFQRSLYLAKDILTGRRDRD